MKFDRNSIKRRRREWIQKQFWRIPKKEEKEPLLPQTMMGVEPQVTQVKRISVLAIQAILSVILLVGVVLGFKSEQPWAKKIQDVTSDAVNQEFNFTKMSAWFEKTFGQFPSILPTLTFKKEEAIPVFSRPLEGTVVNAFKTNHSGVIIETGIRSEVHPIGIGLVTFVGRNKGTGNTVIVQHGDGKESIYGFLGEIYVHRDDWVYPDTILGIVDEQSLFLQIKEKNQYVNPMDVISFD